MTRVRISIGPVSAASARVWAKAARVTLEAVRTRPSLGVPADVVEAFDTHLSEWELHMDGHEFAWSGELDADVLRHLAAHWARLVSLARDDPSAGLEPAEPEGQECFEALATAFATALASVDDDRDRFAPLFEEVVPDFAGGRRAAGADDAVAVGGAGADAAPGIDGARPQRVLVVDDNADIRMLVRVGLQGSGGFVVIGEARDGAEAVAAVTHGCGRDGASLPDAILLDLSMPVMDGEEALPLLRDRCPDARIVVFSADDRRETRERVLALGATDFVRKDAGIGEIIATLRSR